METASRMQVLGLCVNRAGYRNGRRVAQFITEWEAAVRSEGGPITIEQFAEYWRDSLATAYRRLAEFRELFPELDSGRGLPHQLMRPLLERLAAGESVTEDVALVVPA